MSTQTGVAAIGPPSAPEPASGEARSAAPANLRTLDLMRGLAAMAVVVFHLGERTSPLGVTIPGAQVGETGVQVFFVLSGFLIASSVLAPSRFSARDYTWKRVFRILPLYYASLVAVLFGNAVFGQGASSLPDIGAHLLLIHGLFPQYQVAISGVLWTLSIEWMFYILLLLLAPRFRDPRQGWMIAGGMLAVGVCWRIWISIVYAGQLAQLNFLDKQLPGAADVFACGMIVALAVRDERVRRWTANRSVAVIGVVVALAAMFAGLALFDQHAGVSYWRSQPMIIVWPLAFAIACAACVLFIRQLEQPMGPALKWSGLAYLGLISYGIYLLHPLVISALYQVYGAGRPRGPVWLLIPAVLLVTVAVCVLTYRLIERPFMAARRAWTSGGGRLPSLVWAQVRGSTPTDTPVPPRPTRPDSTGLGSRTDDPVAPHDRARSWAGLAAAVVGMAAIAGIVVVTAGPNQHRSSPRPTTTAAAPTTATGGGASWTHVDLDGKPVVVRPGGASSSQFARAPDGTMVPAAVLAVDAAFTADGCRGGQQQYERWTVDHPSTAASRERASAYARYTLDEGRAHGCGWARPPTPGS